MKTRAQIKLEAKSAFQAQYGMSIVIGLLLMAITFALVWVPFAPIVLIPVLSVGALAAYLAISRRQTASVGQLFTPFNQFGRNLGGYWWMFLWQWLWSLLIIPGIIKTYAYSMTLYILADCPGCGARKALRLSIALTEGHKWEIFVFQLSFLGWFLLGALTFGILDILYVLPYYETAMANLFQELKADALRREVVAVEDFQ